MIILLKTMTRKSTISQGKNGGLQVGDVLKKSKLDLIYTYFHYELLTFTEDILDELKIRIDDRIPKPGRDPEKYAFYVKRNLYHRARKACGSDNPIVVVGVANKIVKKKVKCDINRKRKATASFWTRGAMQARNHGH